MIIESKSRPIKTIVLHMIIMAVILITQIFYQVVYAQTSDPVTITSDPALKLVLTPPEEQEYPDKSFIVTLTVDSLIDSNRVGVEWRFPETLLTANGSNNDTISVTSGGKTTITKRFTPKENLPPSVVNRRVEIGVLVRGFVAGENYLSSTVVSIQFTPEMEIFPIKENYSRARTFSTVRMWGLIGLAAVVFAIAIFFAVKQFMKYLNTDDVT